MAEITGDVVVVLAPDAAEPSLPSGLPVRFVHDASAERARSRARSPGSAHVERASRWSSAGTCPSCRPRSSWRCCGSRRKAPVDAVALQDGDRFRPLPVAIRAAAGREAATPSAIRERGSLHSWLQAMRIAVIDEATWTALDPERATLRDVDEPGDLDTT